MVALSGGVDSAVVAALARTALGPAARAATVVGSAVAASEIAAAREVARSLGIRWRLVRAEPLNDPSYRANGSDRCYHCRRVESAALREVASADGASQLLDGLHVDDLADDRPGLRAMDEAGVVHPLLWGRWGKADVRRYARSVGLPNADRPSNACLASRVARGQPITAELLDRIDRAEELLAELGFRRVRVRVHGTAARLEVDPSEVARLEQGDLLGRVRESLLGLGFAAVAVDPRGYLAHEPLPIVP